MLEVKNIHKKFGPNEVLKGVDFKVEKGSVIAVLGNSSDIFMEIVKGDLSLICLLQTADTAEKGCLSRTAVSKNCEYRTFFNFEINTF